MCSTVDVPDFGSLFEDHESYITFGDIFDFVQFSFATNNLTKLDVDCTVYVL